MYAKSVNLFTTLFLGVVFFFGSKAVAQQIEPIGHGHVHEAFMNNEAPIPLLQAVEEEPPRPLQETIPKQPDPDAVWVPGYWEWSQERYAYVWCSGNWRLPPPKHQWIAGYWQEFDEGWVRLRGFWSEIPRTDLTYIGETPPDVLNENPTARPSKDYFWMAGYWEYEDNTFEWYSGRWEKSDVDWIYVPPKYVWRPDGYVFVPAFWDWPLEVRGTAYACVTVPDGTQHIDYGPDLIVNPMDLIEGCLLYYPDYCYFYNYYCHFHVDWWIACPYCPPWWAWDWWWFPWYDQWALWWWWVTPGFPAPFWLPPTVIILFYGPPPALIQAVQDSVPPLIVTPDGVVQPGILIDVLDDGIPIFPVDPRDIQEEAAKSLKLGSTDRPGGKKVPLTAMERQPQPLPPTTVAPPYPKRPGDHPPIPENEEQEETKLEPIPEPEPKPPPRVITPPPRPIVPARPRPPLRPVQPGPPQIVRPPNRHPPQHGHPPLHRPPHRHPPQQWRPPHPPQQWNPPQRGYPPNVETPSDPYGTHGHKGHMH